MTLQDKLEERLCRELDSKKKNENVTLIYKKYMDFIREVDKRENQNVSF